MEEQEMIIPEEELGIDDYEPTPLISLTNMIKQSIVCILFLTMLVLLARFPIKNLGNAAINKIRSALSTDSRSSFGFLARQPIIKDFIGWVNDGWSTMKTVPANTSSSSIRLTPPVPGEIIKDYGWVRLNDSKEPFFHAGINLACINGRPVRASQSGVVHDIKQETHGTWRVCLTHEGGWRTVYGNCSEVTVKPGQQVIAGQELGLSGNSPEEGASVHWEVWQGIQPVNPREFIEQ